MNLFVGMFCTTVGVIVLISGSVLLGCLNIALGIINFMVYFHGRE